jgi:HD-like signal output (HDOD) protein
MNDGGQTFLNAEKEILKLDHAEAASEVCKNWGLPEPLTVPIKYHHKPSESQGSKLAYIIHVADGIAMMAGLGLGIDGTHYQMDPAAMAELDLLEEEVNDIMGEILEAAQNISE